MRIAILTANLGNFDIPVDPVKQEMPEGVEEIYFHRFTDENFPPITGLTPRMQYRIPKMFGWQMVLGYDVYIWLDGTFSFTHPHSVQWFLEKLGKNDAAFFLHPHRNTIQEEVDHIEDHLQKGKPYITSRYKNGLHKESLEYFKSNPNFIDYMLFTSTAFIYKNNTTSHDMLSMWWAYASRYFTCDQIALPYAIYKSNISITKIPDNQYKIPYVTLVSHHK